MTAAAPQQPISFLARPVTTLYGVGPERAAQLARLEIATVEDLLLHRPRRYEDRRHLRPIAELQLHEPAIVHGTVVALGVKWYQQHTRSIFELILDDGTARLHCRWWNLPFMEKYFAMGDEVVVFGKPLGLKPRTIDHPETEVIEAGEERSIHLSRITPIYPLTEGVPQRWLRALIWRTLQAAEPHIPEPWPELTGLITEEPLQVAGCRLQVSTKAVSGKEPPAMKLSAPVERQEELLQVTPEQASGTGQPATCNLQRVTTLPTRAQAIRLLHFPEEEYQADLARQRLALDEFIELQYQIQLRRKKFEAKAQALPCGGDNHLIKPFLAQLQFKLTAAQTRVLRELRKDMAGPHPMRRLLQGDVGSGKTAVAACCALMALESGYNVALMAPTEILAEQHYGTFTKWLQPLGIRIELQTGSTK
ncbi:MAG TPA: DEAD/DEAH box helicase, partial [Candidatus Sulfotelmatobacter sp.]|nr:DEAD/DEAH box helicase [Candidatus Sulfotelmatobacter sp.]